MAAKIFFSCLVLIGMAWTHSFASAADVPLPSLKNKWAFDHMAPESTKCIQVGDSWINTAKKAGAQCRTEESGYSETYKGSVIVCEGRNFSRMILETKTICVDNLETEKANAP